MRCGKQCLTMLFAITSVIVVALVVSFQTWKQPEIPDITSIAKTTQVSSGASDLPKRSPEMNKPGMVLEIFSEEGTGCKKELVLSDKQLLSLPQHTFSTTHTWSKQAEADTFSGPLLEDVLKLACPEDKTPLKLHMRAIDSYAIDVNVANALYFKPTLALSMNGERMTVRNMGHLWLMCPLDDYEWLEEQSLDELLIWQLYHITILKTQ